MRDLLDVIGHDKAKLELGYCNSNYRSNGPYYGDWEENVAKPALVALGYSAVRFSDGERDSFGPLSRIVWAVKDRVTHKFMYG